MSGNPYNSQPETAFWSTAVRHPLSDSGRICIEPIMKSADKTATVCSAGPVLHNTSEKNCWTAVLLM